MMYTSVPIVALDHLAKRDAKTRNAVSNTLTNDGPGQKARLSKATKCCLSKKLERFKTLAANT